MPRHELPRSLARVLDGEGRSRGCAFLAAPGLFVTCTHTVDAALSRPLRTAERPAGEVNLALTGLGWSSPARVREWHPQRDVAVLEPLRPLPREARPLPLALRGRLPEELRAFGVPADHETSGGWTLLRPLGPWLDGRLQAEADGEELIPVQPGFSGGPALDARGRAHGMIDSVDRATGKEAQVVTLVSARSMLELSPGLREARRRRRLGWGARAVALLAGGWVVLAGVVLLLDVWALRQPLDSVAAQRALGVAAALNRGVLRRPEPPYNLAWVLEAGAPDHSESRYREALGYEPGFAPALNNLARLLPRSGRYTEAHDLLVAAEIGLRKRDAAELAIVLKNLAWARLELGNARDALRAAEEAAARAPEQAAPRCLMALAHDALGEPALTHWRACAGLDGGTAEQAWLSEARDRLAGAP